MLFATRQVNANLGPDCMSEAEGEGEDEKSDYSGLSAKALAEAGMCEKYLTLSSGTSFDKRRTAETKSKNKVVETGCVRGVFKVDTVP
jgi:hypothetical protein